MYGKLSKTKAIRLILVFSVLLSWGSAIARAADDREDNDVGLAGQIERLRASIDRSQFDQDELLDRLDYSDQEIVDFVRDDVSLEPYAGLLRGPQGTLESSAGNSLDQAVLLAKLLRDAGFDARVLRTTLSTALATQLETHLHRPLPYRSPFSDPKLAIDLAKRLGVRFSDDREDLHANEKSKSHALQLAETIVGLLERPEGADARLEEDERSEALAFLSDYYWVEHRSSADATWESAHPAWPSSLEQPTSLDVESYFSSAVPEELLHTLTVQAFIDVREGEKVYSKPLSEPWQRPVANLLGRSIRYSNFPIGVALADGESLEKISEALAEADLFFPTLNGGLPPAGQAFDLGGNTLPPDAAASNYAAVFKTVAKKTGAAASAIAGLGNAAGSGAGPQGARQTVSQWLQLTFASPDGSERTFRRDVANVKNSSESFARALARTVDLEVHAGSVSIARILDLLLERFSVVREVADLVSVREALTQEGGERVGQLAHRLQQLDHLEPKLYYSMVDRAAATLSAGTSYRALPALVARYRPVAQISAPLDGFDVVSDLHQFPRLLKDAGVSPFNLRVALGVWQTAVEASIVPWGRSGTRNAYLDWQERGDQAPMVPVANRETRQGASAFKIDDKGVDSWWQVDVQTGETLGMLPNGWGGAARMLLVGVETPEYLKTTMATLVAEIGAAKAGRALTTCGSILAAWEMSKIASGSTSLLPDLPPVLAVVAAGVGVVLQGAELAGGQQAFMKWCVPKVAFALP